MLTNSFNEEVAGGIVSLIASELALMITPVRNPLNPEAEQKIRNARFVGAFYPLLIVPLNLEFGFQTNKDFDKINKYNLIFGSSIGVGFASSYIFGYLCGEVTNIITRRQ